MEIGRPAWRHIIYSADFKASPPHVSRTCPVLERSIVHTNRTRIVIIQIWRVGKTSLKLQSLASFPGL